MFALMGGHSAMAEPLWTKNPTRVDKGDIEISLTPKGVVEGRFRIAVSVDTHSGDLGKLDLQHTALLRVGTSQYQPMKEVKLSGHHATGQLEFPLTVVPEVFEIEIVNWATGGKRVFRWP
jgi:hypothetical protein